MSCYKTERISTQNDNFIQSCAVSEGKSERRSLPVRFGRAFLTAALSVSVLMSCIPLAAFAANTGSTAAADSSTEEKVQESVQPTEVSPSPSPAASPAPASEKTPEEKSVDKAESSGIRTEDAEAAGEKSEEEATEAEAPEPIDGVARVIANFLRDEIGLRNSAISAVLYTIQNKCSFSPIASFDGGSSFGICQWNGTRLDNLKKYCEENVLDCNTVTAQLRFMKEELTNDYPELLESLLVSSNTEAGTVRAEKAFEKYCDMDRDTVSVKNPNSGEQMTAEAYFRVLSGEEERSDFMSVMTAEIITADFLRNEMGLNNAVTAGIMANIYDESGFRPDTLGDEGTAYGICQWGPFRRAALERFCGYHTYDVTTIGAQLAYLKIELESDYPKTLELLNKLEDSVEGTREAARLFCKNIEVPTNLSKQIKERQKVAELMYYPMLNGEEYERFPVDEIMKDDKK